jgi:hypothetical protein
MVTLNRPVALSWRLSSSNSGLVVEPYRSVVYQKASGTFSAMPASRRIWRALDVLGLP